MKSNFHSEISTQREEFYLTRTAQSLYEFQTSLILLDIYYTHSLKVSLFMLIFLEFKITYFSFVTKFPIKAISMLLAPAFILQDFLKLNFSIECDVTSLT